MPSVNRQVPGVVPIWLDCDPGNDDAFAILLACFDPRFRLLGISTVHGNVSLQKTTRNALALLEAMKFRQGEIKVYPGEETALTVISVDAADIHGNYGIGGTNLPEVPGLISEPKGSYIEALRDAILDNDGTICVVCTGALTNLACFIDRYPNEARKIRLVSIMGGAFNCGNFAPNVEFNMRSDPHASQQVFDAPALTNKIILAPLNLTHTALATGPIRSSIYNSNSQNNSPLREMFSNILTFYNQAYVKKFGHKKGPPIHDPLAVFLLLPMIFSESSVSSTDPYDFHYLQRHLRVVTDGEELGRTLYVDKNTDPLRVEKGGVFVAQSVNIPLFWEHLLGALHRADEQVAER